MGYGGRRAPEVKIKFAETACRNERGAVPLRLERSLTMWRWPCSRWLDPSAQGVRWSRAAQTIHSRSVTFLLESDCLVVCRRFGEGPIETVRQNRRLGNSNTSHRQGYKSSLTSRSPECPIRIHSRADSQAVIKSTNPPFDPVQTSFHAPTIHNYRPGCS
jgi:hypothetical protein